MAIAPSRLGQLVLEEWHSEENLVRRLREEGLICFWVSDAALKATFKRAREEHASIPEGVRMFNSPNERVRVFLKPYLTWKGRRWAVPLRSVDPPPWWKFWV